MAGIEKTEALDPEAIKGRLLKAWELSSEELRSIHPNDRMSIKGISIGSPTSKHLIKSCAQILAEYPDDRTEILNIAKDLISHYVRSRCEIRRGGIPSTIDGEIDTTFARFLEEVISSTPSIEVQEPDRIPTQKINAQIRQVL